MFCSQTWWEAHCWHLSDGHCPGDRWPHVSLVNTWQFWPLIGRARCALSTTFLTSQCPIITPRGTKLSRLGDETKHDVSYASVLQSQVLRQHWPIRGQDSDSQPMRKQTARQSHLRHFIPRREWFYGSNFLCSFKTGGSEFQVTAGTLGSDWLRCFLQTSDWPSNFYRPVSTF